MQKCSAHVRQCKLCLKSFFFLSTSHHWNLRPSGVFLDGQTMFSCVPPALTLPHACANHSTGPYYRAWGFWRNFQLYAPLAAAPEPEKAKDGVTHSLAAICSLLTCRGKWPIAWDTLVEQKSTGTLLSLPVLRENSCALIRFGGCSICYKDFDHSWPFCSLGPLYFC